MSERQEAGPVYSPEPVELEAQDTAVLRGHVRTTEISDFLSHAFSTASKDAARGARTVVGPPFGRYVPTRIGFEVEAGCPIDGPLTRVGEAEAGRLPGGPAVSVLHAGSYATVGGAYDAAREWAENHGYDVAGEPWECYLDMPDVARPRTVVYLPLRGAGA